MRSTEAGDLLLDDARRIVRLIGDAKDRLKRLTAGDSGNLRIGFQAAACRRPIMSEALNEFRTGHPAVELELSPIAGLTMEDALQKGDLDGGFFYFEGNTRLSSRRLYVDDWALALPKSHRLASKTKLQLKDLQHENFIILPRRVNPPLNDRFLAAWANGGLSPKIVQEAFEEPMVLNLVAVGLGVAFVLDSVPTELHGNVVLKHVVDFQV
ncbi:MAG TPA: LysR family substrate-binding domain-containing protein, partial [Elusimicrobiota bacterium]|nr:LysR family substrate-binding domain-containing protein [Elusimicrobiota bacterium]